jgi:hypothetical protein
MLSTSVYDAPFWTSSGNMDNMILRTELGSLGGGGRRGVLQLKRCWEVGLWLAPSRIVLWLHTYERTYAFLDYFPLWRAIHEGSPKQGQENFDMEWTNMNRTKERSTKHRNNTGAAQQVPFLLNDDVVTGMTHSGISTYTCPGISHILLYRCVRQAVTNLWRSCFAGISDVCIVFLSHAFMFMF